MKKEEEMSQTQLFVLCSHSERQFNDAVNSLYYFIIAVVIFITLSSLVGLFEAHCLHWWPISDENIHSRDGGSYHFSAPTQEESETNSFAEWK